MRKLFIIFFLLINTLFNFAFAQSVNFSVNNSLKNHSVISADFNNYNVISVDFRGYENAVLKLNQNQEEISAFLSENNNKIQNQEQAFYKTDLKTKLHSNTEQIKFYKSHNISSLLKNEICTRAP